jgi:outer membrane protein
MRNLIKITVLVLFVLAVGSANAQVPKFGHIDFQGLIQVMPERDTAEKAFTKFQTELEDLLGTMQREAQAMIDEFQKLPATTSELVKNAKAQDIQDKQTRIQNFSTSANQQLQAKQSELLKPVIDKAKGAVEAVAKEQGLFYVFDISEQLGVVLYKSNESKDILPLVKMKLKITK